MHDARRYVKTCRRRRRPSKRAQKENIILSVIEAISPEI